MTVAEIESLVENDPRRRQRGALYTPRLQTRQGTAEGLRRLSRMAGPPAADAMSTAGQTEVP